MLRNACPLCKGDVRGNKELKFHCANCNILFERRHLTGKLPIRKEGKPARGQVKKLMPIVASLLGNKLHATNCPFAKNIKARNRLGFSTVAEARKNKNFRLCRCLK